MRELKAMTDQFYPIVIIKQTDDISGEYVAYALDLRGCMREGETPVQALVNLQGAIGEWRLDMAGRGEPVPEPGSFMKEQQKQHEALLTQIRQDQDEIRMELSEQREELRRVKEQVRALKQRLEQVIARQSAMEDAEERLRWGDVADLFDDELEIIIEKPKLPN
jgi:antitoxin HicB